MQTQLGRFPVQIEKPEPLKFAWPIVVLPDLFTTARHLSILVGYFASIGWEVIAPDLRAALGEPAPGDIAATGFSEMVDRVVEALEAIDREAVVLGHGMGGLIALKLAERGRVKAGVAIAPLLPGFRSPLFMRGIRNMVARFRTSPLSPPTGRRLFDLLADADAYQRGNAIATMVAGETKAALEIACGDISFARECPTPRLIVAGEADKFAPLAETRIFAESIGVKLATIPGRGHWLIGGRALERTINETQRFLVRSLGQDLLLLYPEEWKNDPDRQE
ncbi:MAG TPA: alpha/beta fold hydrolase [Candidatus Binataceae bacterium]|nr:alpha/beta fold hydrolase [Candidatus Binataceae bacterium]